MRRAPGRAPCSCFGGGCSAILHISCDQLEYLQSQMDGIVDADVYYFGDYVQRPAGNDNIDVMIYNIVDESLPRLHAGAVRRISYRPAEATRRMSL